MNIQIWYFDTDHGWAKQLKKAIEDHKSTASVENRPISGQVWPKVSKDITILLLVSDDLSGHMEKKTVSNPQLPEQVRLVIRRVNQQPIPEPLHGRPQITMSANTAAIEEVRWILAQPEPWTPSSFDELKLKIIFNIFYRIERILSEVKGTRKFLALALLFIGVLLLSFSALRIIYGKHFLSRLHRSFFETQVSVDIFKVAGHADGDRPNYITDLSKYKNLTIQVKVQRPGRLMIVSRTINDSECLNCQEGLAEWVDKEWSMDSLENALATANGRIALHAIASQSKFFFEDIKEELPKFPTSTKGTSEKSPYYIPLNKKEFDQRLILIDQPYSVSKPVLRLAVNKPAPFELGKVLRTCTTKDISFYTTLGGTQQGMLFRYAMAMHPGDIEPPSLIPLFDDKTASQALEKGQWKVMDTAELGPDHKNGSLIGYVFVLITRGGEERFTYNYLKSSLSNIEELPKLKAKHGVDLFKYPLLGLPEGFEQSWAFLLFDPPCDQESP